MRKSVAFCLTLVFVLWAAGMSALIMAQEGSAEEIFLQEDEQDQDVEYTAEYDQGQAEVQDQGNMEVVDLGDLIDEDEGEDVSDIIGEDISQVLESEEQQRDEVVSQAGVMDFEIPYIENADPEQIAYWQAELEKELSPAGSDGELILSRFLQQELESMGYTVSTQSFHEGFLNSEQIDVPCINLLAERGADGDNRDGTFLLICAHYDSKSNPAKGDLLANDKNGAAVLLEVARLLAAVPANKNLCFVLLSGEEDGWYGSQAFVDNLSPEIISSISGAICIGPVGYIPDATYAVVTDDGTGNETAIRLMAAGMLMNVPVDIDFLQGEGSHSAFLRAGIPAATILDLGAMGVVFGNTEDLAEEMSEESSEEMSEEDSSATAVTAEEAARVLAEEAAGITVKEAARKDGPETEEDVTESEEDITESEEDLETLKTTLADIADAVALTAGVYIGSGLPDWYDDVTNGE